MSGPGDRIPVPTNGHHPPLGHEPEGLPDAAGPTSTPAPRPAPGPSRRGPAAPDLRIAVTPATAAAGFGVLAAIILLILGRRRRGG